VIPTRPYWKGYLKLSLVTCPIALYTASSSTERVSFRQINKQTGNRLRQQLVDEVTREPVEGPDKGRGYEYAKDAYIPVEDDELDAIAIESNHTIEIDSFVPREQIDQRYLDSPFYVIPNDQAGQDAFAVIREAMRGKGTVALGRVVLAKRERVIMLEPWNKGLIGTTLRYPYEIRDAKEYFGDNRRRPAQNGSWSNTTSIAALRRTDAVGPRQKFTTSVLVKEAIGNFLLGFFFGPSRYFPDRSCRRPTHSPSGHRIDRRYVGVADQHLEHHEEQMPRLFSAAGYDFPPIHYLAHLQTHE
jgi:Ku protein